MRAKRIYLLIMCCWLAACQEYGTEENDYSGPTGTNLQNVVFLTGNNVQQTISAFRLDDSGFTFLKTILATSPRTEAQLPLGKYQFLFAASYGNNTRMNIPVAGSTLLPAIRFTVLSDERNPENIREGDELFLQEGKVDSVYAIEGSSTIRASLKRAVAQIILQVKRGWSESERNYIPLPYPDDSIIRYFSNIRLDIENVSTAVDAYGIPQGQSTLSVTFPATAQDSITPEGFAVYTGPFFFPAANGESISLKLNLYRSDDSPQPDLSLTKYAKVKRNEQLILTAWITKDWNMIAVTADTRPISRETDGEQDIWDDHIVF